MTSRLPTDFKSASLPSSDQARKTSESDSARFSDLQLREMMQGVAKRIKIAFRHASNAEIARALDSTDATIKHWTDGNRFPSVELLNFIHLKTGVNLHWLLTGEGEMKSDKTTIYSDEEMERISRLAGERGISNEEMIRQLATAMVEAIEKVSK